LGPFASEWEELCMWRVEDAAAGARRIYQGRLRPLSSRRRRPSGLVYFFFRRARCFPRRARSPLQKIAEEEGVGGKVMAGLSRGQLRWKRATFSHLLLDLSSPSCSSCLFSKDDLGETSFRTKKFVPSLARARSPALLDRTSSRESLLSSGEKGSRGKKEGSGNVGEFFLASGVQMGKRIPPRKWMR